MPSLPNQYDLKTYLGLTTSVDDALIAQIVPQAIAQAERDTGRVFSASSNVTRVYSTNNEFTVPIHDRPYADGSRVVTWSGSTLTEGTSCWFLPDRRDPNISTMLQIKPFDTSVTQWYKAEPMWFDRNLDRGRWPIGLPNDLSITGIIGHPSPRPEIGLAMTILMAFLYWRAKSGATGTAYATTGEAVSLLETPPEYQQFVKDWKVNTGVQAVG